MNFKLKTAALDFEDI